MKITKSKILGLIFLLLVLVVDAFIIYQSCLNAKASTTWSKGVVDTSAEVINTIKEDTINESNYASFSNFIRKFIGHFSLFSLSGILTTLSVYFLTFNEAKIKEYLKTLFCLLPGLILAIITELIQLTKAGRSGEIRDILIDFSGYLLGVLIVYGILVLILKKD